jgi:hypothetical protein
MKVKAQNLEAGMLVVLYAFGSIRTTWHLTKVTVVPSTGDGLGSNASFVAVETEENGTAGLPGGPILFSDSEYEICI